MRSTPCGWKPHRSDGATLDTESSCGRCPITSLMVLSSNSSWSTVAEFRAEHLPKHRHFSHASGIRHNHFLTISIGLLCPPSLFGCKPQPAISPRHDFSMHGRRNSLETGAFPGGVGHDPLWPRPTLATTYFGHVLTDLGHCRSASECMTHTNEGVTQQSLQISVRNGLMLNRLNFYIPPNFAFFFLSSQNSHRFFFRLRLFILLFVNQKLVFLPFGFLLLNPFFFSFFFRSPDSHRRVSPRSLAPLHLPIRYQMIVRPKCFHPFHFSLFLHQLCVCERVLLRKGFVLLFDSASWFRQSFNCVCGGWFARATDFSTVEQESWTSHHQSANPRGQSTSAWPPAHASSSIFAD